MKQLKQDLKNGMSKNEVFKSFQNRNENINKAIRYLSSIPDTFYAKKYSLANYILIGIYSTVTVPILLIRLLASGFSFMVIDLIIYILITYFLFKKKSWIYLALALLMLKSSTAVLTPYLKEPTSLGLLFLLVYFFILVFSLILKIKLFPKQDLFNLKKDENGILIFNHTNE